MAKLGITIKIIPPISQIAGRFTVAAADMPRNMRTEMDSEAKRLQSLVVEEAPKSSGKFAAGITYRSFYRAKTTGFSIYLPQPLGSYLTEGTKPHAINPRGGGSLSFFWTKGPNGPGRYAFKSVFHPGTKPDKFPGRAFRRWIPGARGSLQRISEKYVRTIAGSGTKGGSF